jgi:hypothetical protein
MAFFLFLTHLYKWRHLFRTGIPCPADCYGAHSLRMSTGALVDKNQHSRLKILEVKKEAERKMQLCKIQQMTFESASFPLLFGDL